jgi:YafQ family addiction module toxin component
MRNFSVESKLRKTMSKLSKKDPSMFKILLEKIEEIVNCYDVNHYKNLRKPLQQFKRVHIKSSFVLIFIYLENEDKIVFYDLEHHDNIYN